MFPLRAIAWLLTAAGSLSVLYGLAAGGPASGGARLGSAIAALLHLLYFVLVVRRFAFDEPAGRVRPRDLVPPLLLASAYLLGATGAERASHAAFVAFFAWLAWREGVGMHAVPLAIAALGVATEWRGGGWLAPRDVAVLVALIARLAARFRRTPHYKDLYARYLDHTTTEPPASFPLRWEALPRPLAVLDYGGGNGKRLVELLSWMGVPTETETGRLRYPPRVALHCYDRDASWGGELVEVVANSDHRFTFHPGTLEPSRYDLVHVSHVLYNPRALMAMTRELRGLKDGAWVVVRGMSPNSLFHCASCAETRRVFLPTSGHEWTTRLLEPLERALRLERPSGLAGPLPDVVIRQRCDLAGREDIARLFRAMFGGHVSANSRDFLEGLARSTSVTSLPNDDLVFVYRVRGDASGPA